MARAGMQQESAAGMEEGESIQARFNRQVEDARRRVSEGMAGARERMSDMQSQAYDAWDDAVDYIRENPGKVIAISLGVGLALGLALRFSRRNIIIDEEEV